MAPITPKEFLALGHKRWSEIHWTMLSVQAVPKGFVAYPVGFPNSKGVIVPFALWCVEGKA